MNGEQILSHLGPHPWGSRLIVYREVTSTNTLLKDLGRQGAAHGTVMIADRQTGGRGRLGRSFLSPGGVGIYLSALIRPNVMPGKLMHLTCAVAVAICDAVEAACGIRPGIKWTNDLVIGKRKLAGILTELGLKPGTGLVDYAVIGVGINCCQKEADFDPAIRNMATSLALAAGTPIDRSRLAAEMIRALSAMSDQLQTGKDALMAQYEKDCVTIGRDIQVVRGNEIYLGKATGIDPDGGLIVRRENGEMETVSSGEVSIRGMYGYI